MKNLGVPVPVERISSVHLCTFSVTKAESVVK